MDVDAPVGNTVWLGLLVNTALRKPLYQGPQCAQCRFDATSARIVDRIAIEDVHTLCGGIGTVSGSCGMQRKRDEGRAGHQHARCPKFPAEGEFAHRSAQAHG